MVKLFSVEVDGDDDAVDGFWSSPTLSDTSSSLTRSPVSKTTMNRSSSEWAFQCFLRETSAPDSPSKPDGVAPPSTRDIVNDVVKVKDRQDRNTNQSVTGETTTTSLIGSQQPPNFPIDSKEYQAFLKSQLDLACAAVASTRASYVNTPDSVSTTDNRSYDSSALQLGSHPAAKASRCESSKGHDIETGGLGNPSLLHKQTESSFQVMSMSGSSKENSDDEEDDGETETTQDVKPTDPKRVRRMLSNRESARRSRRRKQAHLTDLETQVSQLRVENSTLLKRLSSVTQKYSEAAVDNRVLKANVETLRAKVMMAEETVKRVTGFNPLFQAIPDTSPIHVPSFVGSPSDTTSDSAATIPDDKKQQQLYQSPPSNHISTLDARRRNGPSDISSLDNMRQSSPTATGGSKVIRTASMQRVASLEHLQKRICGGVSSCGAVE